MAEHQIARDEVWVLVRAGRYLAYRVPNGRNWEWRLEKVDPLENSALSHRNSGKGDFNNRTQFSLAQIEQVRVSQNSQYTASCGRFSAQKWLFGRQK